MSKPKVLVTGIVSRAGLEDLFSTCEVSYSEIPYSRQWVLEHAAAYDAILLMGMKGDQELLDAAQNLKIISVNGVGFDHVDLAYAKKKGVVVANSPQSVRIPTAEMTFALLLSAVKNLYFYDKVVRDGSWIDVSQPEYQGMTLDGTTLGVFGMGRIGKTVARYAQNFGMRVIYHDPFRMPEEMENQLQVRYVEFDEMLAASDVITIHAPLMESTRGVFNERAFSLMKPTAYLINAARGSIIEEDALVQALREHQIKGAGLDVFEFEPTVSEALRSMDCVVMSPHAGTGTVAGRREIAREAAANILAFFAGTPIHVVNG